MLLPVQQAFHIPLQFFKLCFTFIISSVSQVRRHVLTGCGADLDIGRRNLLDPLYNMQDVNAMIIINKYF